MIRLSELGQQSTKLGKMNVQFGQVVSNPYAKAFAPIKEEADHEVSMAQNSLDSIIKNATELKGKVGEMEKNIPGWIQDHITNSENYIEQANSGYHEIGEVVNEGVSQKELDTIKSAVENASSFMNVGSELKKLGMRYIFATSPMPIYIVQPTPNNKVAIVNKKYATKPDFVVGDIAVGVMG
jgi:hypothetical protein